MTKQSKTVINQQPQKLSTQHRCWTLSSAWIPDNHCLWKRHLFV